MYLEVDSADSPPCLIGPGTRNTRIQEKMIQNNWREADQQKSQKLANTCPSKMGNTKTSAKQTVMVRGLWVKRLPGNPTKTIPLCSERINWMVFLVSEDGCDLPHLTYSHGAKWDISCLVQIVATAN